MIPLCIPNNLFVYPVCIPKKKFVYLAFSGYTLTYSLVEGRRAGEWVGDK